MTNLTALVLVTLVTNAPTTNWVTPSGKDIEVGRLVMEQHVISYTNNGIAILRTNHISHLMLVERFTMKEEWIPALPVLRPPPLPQNR